MKNILTYIFILLILLSLIVPVNVITPSAHTKSVLSEWKDLFPRSPSPPMNKTTTMSQFSFINPETHMNGTVLKYRFEDSLSERYRTQFQTGIEMWDGMISGIEVTNANHGAHIRIICNGTHTSSWGRVEFPNVNGNGTYGDGYIDPNDPNNPDKLHGHIREKTRLNEDAVIKISTIAFNRNDPSIAAHEIAHLWGVGDLRTEVSPSQPKNLHSIMAKHSSTDAATDDSPYWTSVTRHDKNAMYIGQNNTWYLDAETNSVNTWNGNWKHWKSPGQFAVNEWQYIRDPDDFNTIKWYRFNSSGIRVTGSTYAGDQFTGTYYHDLQVSGNGYTARTGWNTANTKYYLSGTGEANGRRAHGLTQIGNNWYYFLPSTGVKQTEWQEINGNWYYFDKTTGIRKYDWQIIDGQKFYLDSVDGKLWTGLRTIGGKYYYLNDVQNGTPPNLGKVMTGNHTFGNVTNYFNETAPINDLQRGAMEYIIKEIDLINTSPAIINYPGISYRYYYTPSESGVYETYISAENKKLYYTLYDNEKKILAEENNVNTCVDFEHLYYLKAGQKYYFDVRFSNPSMTGSFTVFLLDSNETTYEIQYNGNADNVTGVPFPDFKVRNYDLTLSRNVPVRAGRKFLGWSNTGGENNMPIYKAPNNLKYTNNVSATLYAVWNASGDINGDGKTNGIDMLLIKQHILNIPGKILSPGTAEFIAADINKDGKVNGLDLLEMKKIILEIGPYAKASNNTSSTSGMDFGMDSGMDSDMKSGMDNTTSSTGDPNNRTSNLGIFDQKPINSTITTKIRNNNSGKYLNYWEDDMVNVENNLTQQTHSTYTSQNWIIKSVEYQSSDPDDDVYEYYYEIYPQNAFITYGNSAVRLTVNSSNPANGTPVICSAPNGSNAQKWELIWLNNDEYLLVSKLNPNLALGVNGFSFLNYATMKLYTYNAYDKNSIDQLTWDIKSYDVNAYAKTITYDATTNGGNAVDPKSVNTLTSTKLPVPVKNDYTLTFNTNGGNALSPKKVSPICNGWYTASSGGTKRGNAGANYSPGSNETLYAQWSNPTAGTLPIPTRFGWNFNGWHEHIAMPSLVTGSTVISGNTTIFAHWTQAVIAWDNSYATNIDSPGLVVYYRFIPAVSSNYTIYSSNNVGDPYVTLYNSAGTQLGYNDDGGGNLNFSLTYNLTAGTTYYYAVRLYSSSATGSFTTNLTAPHYVLDYNAAANSGTVSPTTAKVITGTSTILPTPTKNPVLTYNVNGGNPLSPSSKTLTSTCNGWYTAASGGTKRGNAGGSYTPGGHETLYAQWTDPQAGELPIPTRWGYNFTGWHEHIAMPSPVTNSTVITGNKTIFAQWSAATWIINLNTNYQGNISYGGQEYYFKFTPSATKDYTITNNSSPYPIIVLIYDNNGNWMPGAMKMLLTGENMVYGLSSGNTYYIGTKYAGPLTSIGLFNIKVN